MKNKKILFLVVLLALTVMLAFADNQITTVTIPDNGVYVRNEAFIRNQVTRLTIGRNIRLDLRTFDNQFATFYNTTGRTAGAYVFNNNSWAKE
jgi:hypothetical protein